MTRPVPPKTETVSPSDVSAQFDALLSGRARPEQVEDWAASLMDAHARADLVFEPAADQQRLWRAIQYLSGVGLKLDARTYLHGADDHREYRTTAGF